mmetsp:Transcript_40623/g.101595  ORF Transcript_40623/g.101595 Transcript_40623/m.101595 type:complete len:114 (+) Transcript_40623:1377-1718(+)
MTSHTSERTDRQTLDRREKATAPQPDLHEVKARPSKALPTLHLGQLAGLCLHALSVGGIDTTCEQSIRSDARRITHTVLWYLVCITCVDQCMYVGIKRIPLRSAEHSTDSMLG